MSVWYDTSVFYHMYPLGMTGAPRDHHPSSAPDVCRFSQLEAWIPHIRSLNFNAI